MAEPTRAEHCDLTFGEGLTLSDAGEVALEDYARVLTAAVRAEAVRGDTKYRNHALDAWLKAMAAPYVVEVIERPPGSVGYVKLPKRWVVERTFAWIGRCRRNSRDYELYPHSSEAFIKIGSIHLMLRRLQPDESRPSPPFKYRKNQEIITG